MVNSDSTILTNLPIVKVGLKSALNTYALVNYGCNSELISKDFYDTLFSKKLGPKIKHSDVNTFAANEQTLYTLGSTSLEI